MIIITVEVLAKITQSNIKKQLHVPLHQQSNGVPHHVTKSSARGVAPN